MRRVTSREAVLERLERAVGALHCSRRAPRLPVRLPADAVAVAAHAEVELDGHGLRAVRDQLARLAAHARHLPVERPRHRVEQRGLARPRRAGDREQPPVLEVEDCGLLERREPTHLQAQRPHGSVAASPAASAARASSPLGEQLLEESDELRRGVRAVLRLVVAREQLGRAPGWRSPRPPGRPRAPRTRAARRRRSGSASRTRSAMPGSGRSTSRRTRRCERRGARRPARALRRCVPRSSASGRPEVSGTVVGVTGPARLGVDDAHELLLPALAEVEL